VGRARRTASQLRHQLEREIALNDIRRPPTRKPPSQDPPSGGSTDGKPEASTVSEGEPEPEPGSSEAPKEKSDSDT
jgi:hypothetical protein